MVFGVCDTTPPGSAPVACVGPPGSAPVACVHAWVPLDLPPLHGWVPLDLPLLHVWVPLDLPLLHVWVPLDLPLLHVWVPLDLPQLHVWVPLNLPQLHVWVPLDLPPLHGCGSPWICPRCMGVGPPGSAPVAWVWVPLDLPLLHGCGPRSFSIELLWPPIYCGQLRVTTTNRFTELWTHNNAVSHSKGLQWQKVQAMSKTWRAVLSKFNINITVASWSYSSGLSVCKYEFFKSLAKPGVVLFTSVVKLALYKVRENPVQLVNNWYILVQ